MKGVCAILVLACAVRALAAEVIPAVPKAHFNDYAGVVSAPTAQRLDKTLSDFEQATSNQIVVALFPKMQSDSSMEDYTARVAQSWRVGQKRISNGVVLFVFVQDHKMRIEVGYGLEGALPDVICKRIIDDEIRPKFREGDYDGGLSAGVAAITAATKGEYKPKARGLAGWQIAVAAAPFVFFIVIFLALSIWVKRRNSALYAGHGRRRYSSWGWIAGPGSGSIGGGWSLGSGGGGGDGGGSGGGGSTFFSGGGSFGGGGASGGW